MAKTHHGDKLRLHTLGNAHLMTDTWPAHLRASNS